MLKSQDLFGLLLQNVKVMENLAIMNIPRFKNGMAGKFTISAYEEDILSIKLFLWNT